MQVLPEVDAANNGKDCGEGIHLLQNVFGNNLGLCCCAFLQSFQVAWFRICGFSIPRHPLLRKHVHFLVSFSWKESMSIWHNLTTIILGRLT